MADVIVRGGFIVDGSGQPGRRGDVAVTGDRIVEVGESVDASGASVIDADGLVVAPGFIDVHTHYDAQILWDPDLTPSGWHGVTSVIMGNCGFGVAPTRPEHRSLISRTLENVEGMSVEALEAGITWSFESFPEYLDVIAGAEKRLNVGAMLGHTPLRFFVMGDEATEREAKDSEIEEMQRHVAESVDRGAIGFSTSKQPIHIGEGGKPVPSRVAAVEEIHRLVEPFAGAGRGVIQIAAGPPLESAAELAELSRRSGRPVTWAGFFPGNPTERRTAAQVLAETADAGGDVWPQISCRPLSHQLHLADPFPFESFPAFRELLALPRERRAEVYSNPDWVGRARPQVDTRWGPRWPKTSVQETTMHHDLVGVPLTDVARRRGLPPWDTMVQLSLEENLQTRFYMVLANDDEDEVAVLLQDRRTLLGLSDAGAHASQHCEACYSTHLLGYWVREKQTLTLEEGVRHLTGTPARVFGIPDRGRIAPGMMADLVLFDADRICVGALTRVNDLPAGADRLIVESHGIEHVLVNGVPIVQGGKDVENRPGRMIGR